MKKGFVIDIEKETLNNHNFRKVLYTSKHSQLVLMCIKPNQDIGKEIHEVDQFFRIESGNGICIINDIKYKIKDGFSINIPAGSEHNIINTGNTNLQLYSLYSPPQHIDQIIHKTKKEAQDDEESFDGKLSEYSYSSNYKLESLKKFLEWSTLGNKISNKRDTVFNNEPATNPYAETLLTMNKKVINKNKEKYEKRLNSLKKQLEKNK